MREKKLALIDENTSPLFRIMAVYSANAQNKAFTNNVCAFHIGGGIIISVAHTLRASDGLPVLVSDHFYQNELRNKLQAADRQAFDQIYPLVKGANHRIATGITKESVEPLTKKLNDARVDRRFEKLYAENCCKPYLVTTFRQNAFCNDPALNVHFPANLAFAEPHVKRFTFLIELELLDILVNEDVAIYKVINTHADVINKLPSIQIDCTLYDTGTENYYCLQAAPYDNLGRIINEARIEGILDNFSQEADTLGNVYLVEGIRYLIKGYFRFGSSGAPYLIYDKEQEVFKVNSIQSQASFIQLSIANKVEGNLQYVNGIATPLSIIEQKLNERLAAIT